MEPIFRSLGNGLLLATHVLANKKRETQSMPKYKKISRKTTKTMLNYVLALYNSDPASKYDKEKLNEEVSSVNFKQSHNRFYI
jgi:hypothetical protein